MRIVTESPASKRGLISITEADENAPQNVVFCIPMEAYEVKRITNVRDFHGFFDRGISAKIKQSNVTEIIPLSISKPTFVLNKKSDLPRFTAHINGHNIDFCLSSHNFLSDNIRNNLSFEFYYAGNTDSELLGKRLIILEPNWKQLDRLFLEERILFTDWR